MRLFRKRRRHCSERQWSVPAWRHRSITPSRGILLFDRTSLELHADNDRQLRALDPTGRQLVISCGCALFNARVGLAADRMVEVDRLPDPAKPDLLARLTVLDEPAPWTPLVRLRPHDREAAYQPPGFL